MLKHVGKHNNDRVVILYREVPNESHMCLVVYSDLLPRLIHDEVMKALESPVGQNAKEFSDVLFRTIMTDGNNCLETLHKNGMIKKVPTSQVLVTPTPSSSVRLDELNNILNEMAKGEEAVKRLQDIDQNRGMSGKKAEPREVGVPPSSRTQSVVEGNTSAAEVANAVLSDADIATQRLNQAAKMKAEAKSLLAEAERLEAEAKSFVPAKNVRTKTTKTKAAKKQEA